MRFEVAQKVDEIDYAQFVISMWVDGEKVSIEELKEALKKANSCMTLVKREMIRQDKTMREMYHRS